MPLFFDSSKISSKEILTVSFTLFAVIDIIGSVPILVSLKQKMGGQIKSGQATLASGLLMIIFLLVGKEFLGLLGVSVDAFAVAGSIVIFLLGLELVLGYEFFKSDKDLKTGSVVPIAFPLIAGSGTLTTVMSLKSVAYDWNIFIAIILNCIVIYFTLKLLGFIEKTLGPNGLMIVRKFFGVILLAIAVKIFAKNSITLFN